MARYSIEDIEILRRKSGITYEEAVNLLEYHNGSVARSLVDLEKNGKLKKKAAPRGSSSGESGFKGIFTFLYQTRIKANRGDLVILNVSALVVIITLLSAPHIAIGGLIACLALGYHLSFEKNSPDFASDNFDNLVKKAKDTVTNTVDNISRSFSAKEERDAAAGSGAASGTTPVNVQFPDGGFVNVHEDDDGYHEADIH